MSYARILEPIKINKLEVKNRIFRAAHGTYLGRGTIDAADIAYHEARAKSGVGLITLDFTVVHPSAGSFPAIHAWDDAIIPRFRAIADTLHGHGTKVFAQAGHGGMHWPGIDGSPPISASDLASPWGMAPIAMTEDDIAEIVAAFASASLRMRQGGLDGVELQFGHSYLVHQFLSPSTNHREDRYGGSLDNRTRFAREILHAVRAAVGDDFPVGIRLSDSHAPGGLSVEDCAAMVHSFSSAGMIDFINGSMGSYHDMASMVPAMDTPMGCMLPSSGPIVAAANDTRKVVRMVAGRFQTLGDAETILREDVGDMVGIVRAMIADPNLMAKTLDGREEDVRPCIGCNQACVAGVSPTGLGLACTVNPAAGRELTLSEDLIVPAEHPMKVVIVGGGPAGMEAARVAALSGHKVVLFEASPELGGAIKHARRAPKLNPIGDITQWLEREIFKLGVDVRLSTYADRQDILDEEPDGVIIATGSLPRLDGWSADTPGEPTRGVDQRHVVSSHEIFDVPKDQLGKTAVVFDDVGHYEAIAVAEYLIGQGLAVTFVTRHWSFAPKMDLTHRNGRALTRLREGDFTLVTRAKMIEIREKDCVYGYLDGGQTFTAPADTVVMVSVNRSMTDVYKDLISANEAPGFAISLAGDAFSPRDLQIAITEGHKAGRFIKPVEAKVLVAA